MKSVIFTTMGVLCGIAGIVLGQYFAYRGFSFAPYTGRELGEYFGVMGALVGCMCAFAGVAYNYHSKRLHRIGSGRAAA